MRARRTARRSRYVRARRLHRRARTARSRDAVDKLLDAGRQGRRARPARQRRRPAQRGGAASPRSSSPTARSSRPRAARGPSSVYKATGGAITGEDPGRRARRPRLGLGVGDRHRRAAGPPPRRGRRHAHVRQGRLPGDRALPNGGALDITVGEYFTAQRAQPRRRRRQARAPGSRRTSRRQDNPKTKRDEALDAALRDGRAQRSDARAAARRERAAARRVVAVLEKRGRFLTAEPFFERGRAASIVDRPTGERARRATSCSSRRPGRAPGHGEDRAPARAPGRRARRARGADARPRAAAALRPARRARGARRAAERAPARGRRGATCATCRRSRSTRRPRATSTTRSRPSALDGRRDRASGCTSPTSPRYVRPGLAGRPRGLPARHQRLRARARSSRCCPRRCPTAPARSCPARTGSRSRSSSSFDGAQVARSRVPPLADPLRRAARLRRRSTAIFAGARARRGAVGASRWPPRARSRRALQAARERARRARGRVRRAGVRVRRARATSTGARAEPSRPSRTG